MDAADIFVRYQSRNGDTWVRLDCLAGFADTETGCDVILDAGTRLEIRVKAGEAMAIARDVYVSKQGRPA